MKDISIKEKIAASASDRCFSVLRAYRAGHSLATIADVFNTDVADVQWLLNRALKARISGGYSVGDATEYSAKARR